MSGTTFELDDSQENNNRRDERHSTRDRRDDRRDDRDDENTGGGYFTYESLETNQYRPSIGGISDLVLGQFTRAWEKAGDHEDATLPPAYRRSNFRLIPMASNTGLSSNPVLVLSMNCEIKPGEKKVLVYLFVFQQDATPQTRILQDRGEQYASPIFPEDQLTERYRKLIEAQFPDRNMFMVGSQVVSRRIVAQITSEKDDTALITPLIDNAFSALCGVYENMLAVASGDRSVGARITPRSLKGRARHEGSYDFSGGQIVDTSGIPIQSSITARLHLSTPSQDDDGNYNRIALTELRAGVDLFVIDADDDDRDSRRGFGGRRRGRGNDADPYLQPVLNITSIQPCSKVPFTLETVLLTLDLATRATDNYRFAAAFRSRPAGADGLSSLYDLGDFPRLNPEDENAPHLDLATHLSDSELYDFLESHLHPKVAVAMTVPSSAASSWVLSLFTQMAAEPSNRELVNILFKAADILTGGKFTQRAEEVDLVGRSGDYFVNRVPTRMLVGDWVDEKTGAIRPLSEWNPVTLMTYLGQKRSAVDVAMEFQDTYTNDSFTADHNMARRIELLKRYVPHINVLGQADQVVFTPDLLTTLSLALADCGMDPYISSGEGLQSRRSGGDLGYGRNSSINLGAQGRRRDNDKSRGRTTTSTRDSGYY